jgi:hypothetical protein
MIFDRIGLADNELGRTIKKWAEAGRAGKIIAGEIKFFTNPRVGVM